MKLLNVRNSGLAVLSLSFIALAILTPLASADDEVVSRVGQKVENFSLSDFRGREYSLDEFKESEVVVLIFTGTECPLAKLYAPLLVELSEDLSNQGVTFLAINSNSQDSVTEMSANAQRNKIEFPMLKDVGNKVADQIGATRTPEIFVLDSERVVRYQGRIDDQYGVGSARPNSRTDYLSEAVKALLDNEEIAVSFREPVGCLIGRVREPKLDSSITYTNQVSRILQNRCVECHRKGEIAPFALTDYNEVAGWAEMIAEVVDDRRMPPWHADPAHGDFANDRSLSDEEKQLIFDWVDAGAPFGDESELPEPIDYITGWQLDEEPNLTVSMSEEEFRVKARGTVDYQYFERDPGFTEDKWITGAELLPGNFSVVHHILVFAKPPGQSLDSTGGGAKGYLVAYVPGMRVEPFPKGMAKRIPAGSKLIFQVHYTPVGTEQFDESKLALIYADPDEVTHEVLTTSCVQSSIEIPRNDDNHVEVAHSHVRLNNYDLLSMMPHMHLRGKSFKYELLVPGEEPKTLLDIPEYDFNWQTQYKLASPISLPTGSRIRCTAHYDNSENNPFNPDPNEVVRWGEQTWEEMMIGYFDIAVPIDEANQLYAKNSKNDRTSRAQRRAAEFIASNDENGDGFLEAEELSERLRNVVARFDRDKDGKLNEEEVTAAFMRSR